MNRVTRAALVSAALLIPCFWHPRIAAGDLSSHVYNAWLADLASRGEAPGITVSRQTHNVLFDWILTGAARLVGFSDAEKLAVPPCVLVFFWGAFAFVTALTGRAPWRLTPAIAAIAYGWTFNAGFFNYYLSVGLAFLAIAVVWRGRGWQRAAAVPLLVLMYVASSLGVAWFAAALAYLVLGERWRGRGRVLLLPLTLAVLWAAGVFVIRRYHGRKAVDAFAMMGGADQLAVYGTRYFALAVVALILAATIVLTHVAVHWRTEKRLALPLTTVEMYLALFAAAGLLPDRFYVPPYGAAFSLLVPRLTTVTAIVGLVLIASADDRRWHVPAIAVVAAVFFTFLYLDTRMLNRAEAEAAALVEKIPRGSRLLFTLAVPLDWRLWLVQTHLPERACIGRCFNYQNYEPLARLFRIRVAQNSPIARTDSRSICEMAHGIYVVQQRDLPAFQLYQRSEHLPDLALRELRAGELNGAIGYKDPRPYEPCY